ncbi:MAG: hypothetical protein FWG68_12935 [Defluviitaleaceae bacterium]|nr:hypothetical protein [Defluviitaleaceae bacterium]
MSKLIEQTKPKKRRRIFWHDAFAWGYKAEFAEEADKLEFIEEYELSKQALKMDVLVIKKPPDVTIHKNIGKIFREHNITEYKSPTDNLNIWDYQKVLSYAYLYSSSKKIAPSKITLTFVLTIRPRDLLKYFKAENLQITEVESGITYVTGGVFPVQILESKKLSAETNLYLQHLRSNWTKEDFAKVIQKFEETNQFDFKNIYLSRTCAANEEVTKGEGSDMLSVEDIMMERVNENEAFRERISQKVDAENLEDIVQKKAAKDKTFRAQMLKSLGGEDPETAQKLGFTQATLALLKEGFGTKKIAEMLNQPLEWVENLAKTQQPDGV